MNFLIIGSNDFRCLVGQAIGFDCDTRGEVCEIREASCLELAKLWIPTVDGIVCEQSFPTHASRVKEPLQTQSGNWAAVALSAKKAKVPFVLITPSHTLAEMLQGVWREDVNCAWPCFALIGPSSPSIIADTIVSAAIAQMAGKEIVNSK